MCIIPINTQNHLNLMTLLQACIINAVFTRKHITYAAPWYVYVHNNTLMVPNDVYYGANVMLYYT